MKQETLKVNIKKLHPDAVVPRGSTVVKCQFCGKEEIVFNSRAKDYKYCSKECMQKAYVKVEQPKAGERINNWEVKCDNIVRKNGRRYVSVKCTCGSEIEKLLPYHHYKDKLSMGCHKCSKNFTNTGYGEISGVFWSQIKTGAKRRNITFDITIEDAWELYQKQKGKCAISGVDICFSPTTNKKDRCYQTASLDRIDSTKGYSIENVQWVHKDINLMKNKFSMEYFQEVALSLASKANLKVKIKRLHPNSVIPTYAHSTDCGLDLTAVSKTFDEYGNVVYGFGLAFEIPEGYAGFIFPRSSNHKSGLLLANSVGVIDAGYRGEVTAKFVSRITTSLPRTLWHRLKFFFTGKIKSYNMSTWHHFSENGNYNIGDRVAQMVILPYPKVKFVEVDELSDTERGTGGYGSTGK